MGYVKFVCADFKILFANLFQQGLFHAIPIRLQEGAPSPWAQDILLLRRQNYQALGASLAQMMKVVDNAACCDESSFPPKNSSYLFIGEVPGWRCCDHIEHFCCVLRFVRVLFYYSSVRWVISVWTAMNLAAINQSVSIHSFSTVMQITCLL